MYGNSHILNFLPKNKYIIFLIPVSVFVFVIEYFIYHLFIIYHLSKLIMDLDSG